MIRFLLSAALLFCWSAAAAQPVTNATPPHNSVKLVRVVVALPTDKPWLRLKQDSLCIQNTLSKMWTSGRQQQELSIYSGAFKAELERSGYQVVTPADDLFNADTSAADLDVAAVVAEVNIEGCLSPGGYFNTERDSVRGTSEMKVDWQIILPFASKWWHVSVRMVRQSLKTALPGA